MFNCLKNLFRASDAKVAQRYLNAGTEFGDAVSYIYMGECVGFEKMLDKWAKLEKEYASRGYKTISIDDFIKAGGYGKDISDLLMIKVDKEQPLHAEIYKKHFLGKMGDSVIDPNVREVQTGIYFLPSTENIK